MRPLSQVDPWNGCEVCRSQAELGYMPHHDWRHELRMWWNNKVPAWTYGTNPRHEHEHEHEPSESRAVGVSGSAVGLAGIALSFLTGEVWKGSEDKSRPGPLASCYYAGRLAALLAEKYRPSTIKEATDAR